MRGLKAGAALAGVMLMACGAPVAEDGGQPIDAAHTVPDGGHDAGLSLDAGQDGGSVSDARPCERPFYVDEDGDGFGDPARSVIACDAPAGHVDNADDCYDGSADARPGQTEWFEEHRGDESFDYDCDGDEAQLWTDFGTCPDTSMEPPIPGTVGWWSTVPPCGTSAVWKSSAAICSAHLMVSQQCR